MADVFISYAHSTARPAKLIAEALRSGGYSVWIDDELPVHRDYPTVIEEQLQAAKAVLVIWSKDARASRWVPAEADMAHAAGTLVQFSLDGALPPLPFNRMQCEQAPGWSGDFQATAWKKVLDSIAELVGRNAPAKPASVLNAPREQLLAVLAFDNISGDQELTYFSDGVSEEIQQTVAQGSQLRVVARSSSFQFRGPEKAVRNVASALMATHILDGSVRLGGTRVRVAAQLVECAGETTLWADRFEGDLTDIFALQDRIAEGVARALKVTLAPPAQTAPLDPNVYEEFLRTRAMITEGSGLFDDVAAETTPLLEGVVAAAPEFAPAWALLARARAWTLRSGHRQGSYAEGRAGVVEAAEAALRLDPKREGAYLALAMLEPWGAYAAREKLLKRALDVSPNEPSALTEMSSFCWQVGRFGDALRFAEQACELNPLMPAARLQVAQMRTYVGDYEASVRMHQELLRRWPHNLAILMSLLNTASRLGFWQAYDQAIEGISKFQGWQGSDLHAAQTYAETLRSNDPAKRADRLRRYTALLEKTGTLPLNLVESLSSFGMAEEAMALAERASFAHMFDPDGPLPSAYFPGVILSRWSELNRSRRFMDLCDRLGLCAYWAESRCWPDCVEWDPYDFKGEALRRVSSSDHPA